MLRGGQERAKKAGTNYSEENTETEEDKMMIIKKNYNVGEVYILHTFWYISL